jgi:hypothetical protein
MDLRFKTAILAMGLALASNANADLYDFSETISGVSITGSFTGTASGNDITGISNISVIADGVAFSGPLESDAYHGTSWTLGQGIVSINGADNNFVFINQGWLANNALLTNYLQNIDTPQYPVYQNAVYISNQSTVDNVLTAAPTNWSVTDVTSVPVPAAVWLFGSVLAGFIGFNRRKSA